MSIYRCKKHADKQQKCKDVLLLKRQCEHLNAKKKKTGSAKRLSGKDFGSNTLLICNNVTPTAFK